MCLVVCDVYSKLPCVSLLARLAGLTRDRLLTPVPSFPPHENNEQLRDQGQASPERIQPAVSNRILHVLVSIMDDQVIATLYA